MSWLRFWRRRYWDEERARELDAYLAIEIDDNMALGMTRAEAERAARRKLGNVTRIREEIYDMNTMTLVESIWQDLRYGARLLWRNPLFAMVAILTLALGTGANTAIFHLLDVMKLRALPVADPAQLMEIRVDDGGHGRTGRFMSRYPRLTNPLWERIREEQQGFSSVMAWSPTRWDLAQGGEVHRAQGIWVSGDFFATLGVHAHVGRMLSAADDTRGCAAPGAILSYGFWRRAFAGDRSAIGRAIALDGHQFEIVGVTEQSFFGVDVGRSFDVALPICAEPIIAREQSALDQRDSWFLSAFGRLKPDWTPERANAQLAAISTGIFHATLPARYGANDARDYLAFRLTASRAPSGVSALRRSYETPLWILLGATGLVLVIACANLANLMLARATAREQEVAIRLAIGASRARIVRQMLAESVLVAIIGAAAGVLVAVWLSRALVAFLSTQGSPLSFDLSLDWRVLAFTATIATCACLLFGLAPAIRATAARASATIRATGRGNTEPRERFTVRRALVIVQVALSLVLVVGGLLFGGSLRNLTTLDPGFQKDGLLVVNLDFRRADVPAEQRGDRYNRIVQRLGALPGVTSAAQVYILPVSGSVWNNRIVVDGRVQQPIVNVNAVGPGYFKTMGTSIVAGREFSSRDTAQSPKVAIVNELFAKTFLANKDPLTQSFQIEAPAGEPRPAYQIVGVVANSKYTDLREPMTPLAYLDAGQDPAQDPSLQAVLRTAVSTRAVTSEVIRAIREENPVISVQFTTMEQTVRDSLLSERLMASLSAFFAALAAFIATIGLYGVMSYMVARRKTEIGIRMALGADRQTVLRLVLGEAGVLLAIGLVAGIGLAIAGGRAAAALLYGLKPWDAPTLLAGVGGLAAVAILASWLPAHRATRVEPTVALRAE